MRNHWYIPTAVLLVLAVVGFFAGWLQLSLGPDTWGVVFVRSHGFENAPVDPSGFTWRFQRLIPRSLTLYRIPLAAEKADLVVNASLPSAEAYASIMPEKPDFSIEMNLSFLYRLRPQALPALVQTEGLRQETASRWHQQLRADIQRQAADIALGIAEGAAPVAGGGAGPGEGGALLADAVTRGLRERFPRIEFISIAPAVVRMPDPQLYAKLKSASLRLADRQEAALAALAPKLAMDGSAQRAALQRQDASVALLTRYGELFDKYPSLIRFLFLATSQKLTSRDLQTLDLLDKFPAME